MERLVIDCETGGLRPHEHSLLTVGMVLVDVTPKSLTFVEEEHIFIKHHEYNVSKTALRINGINLVEHHKIGVFPDRALLKMNKFVDKNLLYETPILGHNVHFDIGFLNVLCDELGKKFPFSRTREDTRYIWEGLKRKGLINPFKNAKLGTIANHFDIDYSAAHDALADCKITANVYQKMLGVLEE